LIYIDILLSVGAILFSFGIFVINIRKRKFVLNRILLLASFFIGMQFILHSLLLFKINFIYQIEPGKIYIGIALIIAILSFNMSQIYPDGEFIKRFKSIFLADIPGLIIIIIIFFTDIIEFKITFVDYIKFIPGNNFYIFVLALIFYLFGVMAELLYKLNKLTDKPLKKEILYTLMGVSAGFGMMLLLFVIWPLYFNINEFINIGVALPEIFILLIINHSVLDFKKINFKKFYIIIFSRIFLFLLLFIPVYLILTYKDNLFLTYNINNNISSIFIFFTLLILYKFLKPKIDLLAKGEYLKYSVQFNDFFNSLPEKISKLKEDDYWGDFFDLTIKPLKNQFNISDVYFFKKNTDNDNFSLIYFLGKKIIDNIDNNDCIVKSIKIYPKTITKSILYYDQGLILCKENSIKFMENNNLEIILPVYNSDDELIAILLIGRMRGDKLPSKEFIDSIEIYKIYFQNYYLNRLILGEIKLNQSITHDKIIISKIKSRIIPERMSQVRGVRVTSFFKNNSEFGGDYFDSIIIDNKMAIFISDLLNDGIESAIVGLELYTIFNSKATILKSPEMTLNTMNWVLSSSKFSEKHIPALSLFISPGNKITYSSAAFNSILFFNADINEFIENKITGVPLGINQNHKYLSETIQLTTGSFGIIYSSGFISDINKNDDSIFNLSQLKSIILSNKEDSPAILVRKIFNDFNKNNNSVNKEKDITLIIFKL